MSGSVDVRDVGGGNCGDGNGGDEFEHTGIGPGLSAARGAGSNADAPARHMGRVVHFDARRGFGWVFDFATGTTLGAHHTHICPKFFGPSQLTRKYYLFPGECVTFDVGTDPTNGKPCCTGIAGMCAGGNAFDWTLVMDHVVLKCLRSRGSSTPPASRWRPYAYAAPAPPGEPVEDAANEARAGSALDAKRANSVPLEARRLGRVTSYHARKGWGWIVDDTGAPHFVHHSEIKPLWPADRLMQAQFSGFKNCLYTGECVEFSLGINAAGGRPCCQFVTGVMQGALLMDYGLYACTRYRSEGEYSGEGERSVGDAGGPHEEAEHGSHREETSEKRGAENE